MFINSFAISILFSRVLDFSQQLIFSKFINNSLDKQPKQLWGIKTWRKTQKYSVGNMSAEKQIRQKKFPLLALSEEMILAVKLIAIIEIAKKEV